MAARKTVMMACVSFETVMVVEPAVTYNVDEIHLFHYVRGGEAAEIYGKFYGEVARRLASELPRAAVVEHSAYPVYKFQPMLREMLSAVESVRAESEDSEILINVSSGTAEFSAAAVVVSMMCRGVTAFTVGTREYTVRPSDLEALYFRDGRPVGLTAEIYDPRPIPSFVLDMPDENLVRSLRIYSGRREAKQQVTAVAMIAALKEAGLWDYVPDPKCRKTDSRQKEVMYYQRNYIEPWHDNGWTAKAGSRSKYDLTEKGRNVIDTFHVGPRVGPS